MVYKFLLILILSYFSKTILAQTNDPCPESMYPLKHLRDQCKELFFDKNPENLLAAEMFNAKQKRMIYQDECSDLVNNYPSDLKRNGLHNIAAMVRRATCLLDVEEPCPSDKNLTPIQQKLCELNYLTRRARSILEIEDPCPISEYPHYNQRQRCYMRVVLAKAVKDNAKRPFGAMIVNEETNTIACWGGLSTGPNSDTLKKSKNRIHHGEKTAIENCTLLFPTSHPSGDERNFPGLNWRNHTMYTTAVPCMMCGGAALWVQLGKVVYGTDEEFLENLTENSPLSYPQFIPLPKQYRSFGAKHNFTYPPEPPLLEQVLEGETNDAFRNGSMLP